MNFLRNSYRVLRYVNDALTPFIVGYEINQSINDDDDKQVVRYVHLDENIAEKEIDWKLPVMSLMIFTLLIGVIVKLFSFLKNQMKRERREEVQLEQVNF